MESFAIKSPQTNGLNKREYEYNIRQIKRHIICINLSATLAKAFMDREN